MAHNISFFEALDRSEARRDGGYKQNWSFSLSEGSEEERRHDCTSVVTTKEMDGQQHSSPEGQKSPALRHFSSADPLKTYENRPNTNNHIRALNKLGTGKRLSEIPYPVATTSPMPNRTDYLIGSPTTPQGVVLQGRHFQHTHHVPAAMRKPVQSNLDLKERKEYSTTQQQIQPVEVESIILTCPESPANDNSSIKRRVQQHSRRASAEGCCSFPSQVQTEEALHPNVVCGKCSKSSDNSIMCEHCGNPLALEAPHLHHPPAAQPTSPTPRPPIRPHTHQHPSPGANNLQLRKNSFYGSASTLRAPPLRVDTVMNPPIPVRITTRAGLLLPHNGRPVGAGLVGSCCAGKVAANKGRRTAAAKLHKINDPIVLSSDDDEEDEADDGSTGSVNRLDSVSPLPADSAHSSPAPSGGRVEAAVKSSAGEEQEEITSDFFADVDSRISLPKRNRMKDQFGNQIPDDSTPRKKQKTSPYKLDSIILDCRSVRVGTLRRMVTKPVIFTGDYIQLETEVLCIPGPEVDSLEKVRLQASGLISCEWCSVRKLPVLFFQTTQEECLRLRTQLKMTRDKGGLWYDCASNDSDEKYIVLIFENGLSLHEQMILEEILQEIGRVNKLNEFPTKLPFDEANIRLVNYNKATKEKVKNNNNNGGKANNTPPPTVRTRMATRQQTSTFFDEEDDDMAELQPTFTGPIVKLMVYPPPPAKGGMSVTNEDLHCLNDGEFLNDVIIDFYLKYLVLEKLKKEDSQRSHVFSSFFYKRLNQRERRNIPDTTNLTIQKRKHNRVKTWTRHVDLFQKDFIFVPINESAHWYLAVICFPGLQGPQFVANPLFQAPESAPGPTQAAPQGSPPDHCRPLSPEPDHFEPLSPDREEPVTPSEKLSLSATEASSGGHSHSEQPKGVSTCPNGGQEPPKTSGARVNGQVSAQPQYTDGLHRISVCYGSGGGNGDDTHTFSDDQSSCQDECSEDGALAEDPVTPESSECTSKPTICKQPCILIMDSLRGPARSSVVKTLREYLEVEWEVRKGSQRSFGKDQMKGSNPRVPQQDNFSDCGVYILQYVESFFESPLASFHLPVNLAEWFLQQRMKTKREEIKELIRKIQSQQKKEAGQGSAKGSPEEQEVGGEDTEEGVEIQIQNFPVSP
ncbi:sentrin-specific protease 6 isoform X1 [Oncorhynchus kisutch]|uniref:Sentrin-specific protease 6 n=2 Tax=Oncorhynchus kisutch TaxID=8019 RepID=A0A8C7KJJ1_ONCKI|nr:sentrin-specific protease 6 isoform X1 [Oncorhynchus kisutch]